LEYDPDFVALEDAVRIEPEQQFGDTIVPAEEPEWESVRELAVELLSRTKDLRAAVHLVGALVHGNGLPGLAQGLQLVRALVETFWDSLHPQLDPDDDLDPTARMNIIASLGDSSLILAVRHAPIFQIPGLGSISYRDVQIANGQLPAPPDSEEILKLDTIQAAIHDLELSTLEDTVAVVEGAIEDVCAIEQSLMDAVGATQVVSLEALTHELRGILAFLNEQMVARGDTEPEEVEEGDEESVSGAGDPRGSRLKSQVSGEIRSSQDVIRALDSVIAYFRVNEPSSPVPLLLERAKRLVSRGFLEILNDIAPDGLSQAEQVTGASIEVPE
jgi:type VI secretion system protein ImpA